jgi:hypothetical protein
MPIDAWPLAIGLRQGAKNAAYARLRPVHGGPGVMGLDAASETMGRRED